MQQIIPRIALIGIGDAGKHHGRALSKLHEEGVIDWVGSVARTEESYQTFTDELGLQVYGDRFTSVHAVNGIAMQPRFADIAVIATPDHMHKEHIQQCMSAGVSVLAEKPLVEEPIRAIVLADNAKRDRLLLRAGYHHRYHAGHIAAKQNVGKIGDIEKIDMSWSWKDPNADGWRADPDSSHSWAIAALGTHLLDFAYWMTDDQEVMHIKNVERSPEYGPDRVIDVDLETESGVRVSMHASIEESERSQVTLQGSEGTLHYDSTFGARGSGDITLTDSLNNRAPVDFKQTNPYEAQLRDFIEDHKSAHRMTVAEKVSLVRNVDLLRSIQRFNAHKGATL